MAIQLSKELPPSVREPLSRALASKQPRGKAATGWLVEALRAVEYPVLTSYHQALYPDPRRLSPPQRAVLEVVCDERFGPIDGFAFPFQPAGRAQWFDGSTVLESLRVKLDQPGRGAAEPLGRALQIKHLEPGSLKQMASVLNALPIAHALEAIAELVQGGADVYRLNITDIFASGELRLVREMKGEGRDWALRIASKLPEGRYKTELSPFVFLALVRAGVAIDRQLEDLFPDSSSFRFRQLHPPTPAYPRFGLKDYLELVRALPESRRDPVLAPHMYRLPRAWALEVLEKFPSPALARALLDDYQVDVVKHGSNPAEWQAWVDDIKKLGRKHPTLLSAVQESVEGAPVPHELFSLGSVVIGDAAKLDGLQRRQLTRAAKLWDGKNIPLSKRLGSKGPSQPPKDGVSSFLGSVEFRRIGNAQGEHLFDALLYDIGAGTLFNAGSDKDIGYLGDQIGVHLNREDDELRMGLRPVLGSKPRVLSGSKKGRAFPKAKGVGKR